MPSGARDTVDRALVPGRLLSQRGLRVGPVVGDIGLAGDRDLHRVDRRPLRLPLGAVKRDALANHLGRRILVEDQVEAALRGAADRGLAAGRDPERRMRLLRRRRLDHDVVELPEFAAVREALRAT